MKAIRLLLLIPTVLIMGFVTFVASLYLCMSLTVFNVEFGAELYETMNLGDYMVNELYDNQLEAIAGDIKERYIDPQTEAYNLKEISTARIVTLVKIHIPQEKLKETIDSIVLDSYRYILDDEAELPVIDIKYIIDGIGNAVPELVDEYLEGYFLPNTGQVANFLEKGYDTGIINDVSVDWLMTFIKTSNGDFEGVDEATIKKFLTANEQNFKEGNFDASELSKTYIREQVMGELSYRGIEDSLSFEQLIEDGFGGIELLGQLRTLRQEILPIIGSMLVVVVVAMMVILFLLAYRPNVGFKLLGVVMIIVGGLLVIGDLMNLTSGLIRNMNDGLFDIEIDPAVIGLIDVNGLKRGIAMMNGVYLSIHGAMLIVGILLVVIGVLLTRRLRLKFPDPEVDVSTSWVWELVVIVAALVLYIGGYRYMVSVITTLQNIQL